MSIRRVVSGQLANGKSVIVSDEKIEGVQVVPGASVYPMWGADTAPSFPTDGLPPGFKEFFPTAGGYRFFLFTVLPSGSGRDAAPAAPAPLSQETQSVIGSNMQRHHEADSPGMHTTDTVDLEVVLSGEVGLELDDGAKIFLNAGDVFIQNGTRHRWINRGTVPAVVACVLIGGHPRGHGTGADTH